MYHNKIRALELDPNGYCNAKCWYCPVQYETTVNKTHLSIEKIQEILEFFFEEKQKNLIVSEHFEVIWTSAYNEILLYPHFEQLLELFRMYNFKTPILSHGLNLTSAKVDLIKEYSDVIVSLGLNVPAFTKELWSKRSGFQESHFDKLINNIQYADVALKDSNIDQYIFVNGLTDSNINKYQIQQKLIKSGWTQQEQMEQVFLGKSLFKNFIVIPYGINSRSNNLEEYIIIKDVNVQASACGMEMDHSNDPIFPGVKNKNFGNRMRNWLHIGPNGDTFVCCLDYKHDYVFGNVYENSIDEIWNSQRRIDVLKSALSNFCIHCEFAV